MPWGCPGPSERKGTGPSFPEDDPPTGHVTEPAATFQLPRSTFPLRDLKSLSWLQVTRDSAGVRCALDAGVIEGYSHIGLTLIILLDLASGS